MTGTEMGMSLEETQKRLERSAARAPIPLPYKTAQTARYHPRA